MKMIACPAVIVVTTTLLLSFLHRTDGLTCSELVFKLVSKSQPPHEGPGINASLWFDFFIELDRTRITELTERSRDIHPLRWHILTSCQSFHQTSVFGQIESAFGSQPRTGIIYMENWFGVWDAFMDANGCNCWRGQVMNSSAWTDAFPTVPCSAKVFERIAGPIGSINTHRWFEAFMMMDINGNKAIDLDEWQDHIGCEEEYNNNSAFRNIDTFFGSFVPGRLGVQNWVEAWEKFMKQDGCHCSRTVPFSVWTTKMPLL